MAEVAGWAWVLRSQQVCNRLSIICGHYTDQCSNPGGVGLLGGVLLGEAIESHDDYEYDQGFQDGEQEIQSVIIRKYTTADHTTVGFDAGDGF